MYEHNVKPELEKAVQLLHSIDYFSQSSVEIAAITGRAVSVLNSMLICNPDKELIWTTLKTSTTDNKSESRYTARSGGSNPPSKL